MKNNKKKLIALILSLITLSGCASKSSNNSDNVITIDKSATISGTLDAISQDTYIDEKVETYCNTDETTKSIEELDMLFKEAQNNGDLRKCNNILSQMGDLIIKAKIASVYGIEIDDISEFHYNIETNPEKHIGASVNGEFLKSFNNEMGEYEYETFSLYTEGDLSNLVINTQRASVAGWELEKIDDVYLAMIRALLQSEEVYTKKLNFVDHDYIKSSSNENKVNDYNEYVKTLS